MDENTVYLLCKIDELELVNRFQPDDGEEAAEYLYYGPVRTVLRAMFGIELMALEISDNPTGEIIGEAKAEGLAE